MTSPPAPASRPSLPTPAVGKPSGPTASVIVVICLGCGVVVGLLTALFVSWDLAMLIGWMAGSALFVVWVLGMTLRLDADHTAAHAVRDDAQRTLADLTVLTAAVASLGAVGLLISGTTGVSKVEAAALAVGSIALAWTVVHTLFMTRYARLYYSDEDGGIDFNEDGPPAYPEFAYLAFTLGMTFQVSDTDIQDKTIRHTALRHALLSFVFGAIILATTINLIAGMAK